MKITNLTYALVTVVGLSTLAAWVVSELVLELYRRSVVRSMGGIRSKPRRKPPAGRPTLVQDSLLALSVLTAEDPLSPAMSSAANALYGRATDARKSIAIVYAVAGCACAAILATATTMRWQSSPLRWFVLFIGFAWPVVWIAILSGAVTRRMFVLVAIGYFGVVVWAAQDTIWSVFGYLLLSNVFISVVPLALRARRIRAVAPLVAAFASIQAGALMAMLGVSGVFAQDAADLSIAQTMERVQLALSSPSTAVEVVTLFVTGHVIGWFILQFVGHHYERKHASDQAITMGAMWLPVVSVQALVFAHDNAIWMLAGLVAFVLFLGVSLAGLRWTARRRARSELAPRLLVLRVFALGRRSRRLFDAISDWWRYVGSVQLIAGPDLATSTVEPHEFFDFLRRKLKSRFIDDDRAVDVRLSEMDLAPDHDGRFRVTDFFCHDHAWRTVLRRLARDSDVVLMDLRGFSTLNSGCTYELGELLITVPLARIVMITDKHTDEPFLSQVLADAWALVPEDSPNYGISSPSLSVFREAGWRGLDRPKLLRMLCGAVGQAPAEPAADPIAFPEGVSSSV